MDEISCRAAVQLLDGLRRLGLDPERAIRDASLDPASVRDPDQMIDWDAFVDLHQAAERQGLGAEDFETIGESLPQLPSAGTVARIARFLVTPKQLYDVSYRWIAPNLFPLLRVHRRVLGRDELELTIEIPPSRRGCEAFLRVNLGLARVVPTMLGYPKAHIEAELDPHTARFRIRLPHRASLVQRVRVQAQALLSPGAIIRELGRQQAEITARYEALVRARRDFRQVIERIPDLVIICRAGSVVYANPASSRALGAADGRPIVGVHLLDLVHHDDRAAAARHLSTTEAPASSRPAQLRFFESSGDPILLEVAPAQWIDFENKPAILLVARDLTESHRLRDQLARADRLSSLGSLVATVGHELSNPLGYVSLNLGVLERIIERSVELAGRDRAIEALRSARQGATRAREILRELTTFSRGTETHESLAVREAIEAAAQLAGKEVQQRAALVSEYDAAPPVRCNRGRLEQVIVNLLLNAAQSFASDDPSANRVTIRTRTSEDQWALIEVEDNGIGMDETTCAQIFDPFFSTKPAGEGTGLGLSICRDIIEEFGGEILVESSPGHGSRFLVRLPADRSRQSSQSARRPHKPATPPKPAPEPAPEPAPTSRARVLIIDDEPNLTEFLSEVLTGEHEVVAVASAEDALELFERDSAFDIILCDIKMKGLSGIDLYDRLSSSRPELAHRITFMTGGAFAEPTRAFLAGVPNGYIEKPFDLGRVLEIVAQAGRHRVSPTDQ